MLTASYDRSKRQMSEKCTDKVASWVHAVCAKYWCIIKFSGIDRALSKQIAGTALTMASEQSENEYCW